MHRRTPYLLRGRLRLAAGQASTLTFQDTDRDLVRDVGEPFVRSAHQATNEANEIVEYFSSNGTQSATTTGFAYDGSGSLVFDGGHFYVYDAWNRLTEVRGPGDLMVDSDGVLLGTPGLPQERFRYDALGRKVVSEVLTGELAGVTRHVYGTGAAVLAEYDVTTDGVGGDQETLTRWFVHGEGFPEPLVLVDVTDAGVESAGTSEVLYYLTDALGSVGMLADAAGAAAELYMYTPYGPTTIAWPGTGYGRTTSLFGNPLAWTGQRYSPTTALYHFWARSYSPLLGRFLQEDMQGALAAVDISLGGEAQSASISGPSAAADGEYVDGLNLFLYAGANPVNRFDSFGLDWDEDVDDVIADVTGHKVATLGFLNEGSSYAILGAHAALNIAGSLLGVDLFTAAGNIFSGEGTFSDFLVAGMYALPVGIVAGKAVVKAIGWTSKFRKVARGERALEVSAKMAKLTACFGVGTMVNMADGSAKPIEQIVPGNVVACDYDPAMEDGSEACIVSGTFRRATDTLLALHLDSGDSTVAIEVTAEHPFYVPAIGRYVPAGELSGGTGLLTALGDSRAVVDADVQSGQREAYNLEVSGAHNYYVRAPGGGPFVLVHNAACPIDKETIIASSKQIATGTDIREVERLIRDYGGRAKNWIKKKGRDVDGTEWHWYENLRDGLGRVEWKPK